MADSFEKKEREKKKELKKREKAAKKLRLKEDGSKTAEFMYLDVTGNLTTEKQEHGIFVTDLETANILISTPKKEDLISTDPVRIGIVKFFNKDKGYGFINDKETNESYFVHINNVDGEINDNNKVSFEIGSGPKGKTAINVKQYKS